MHKKQNQPIYANNGKNIKKTHKDEYNADLDSPDKQQLTPEIKEQKQYIQQMSNYLNERMKKLQQKIKQKIIEAHNFINSQTKLNQFYLQQRYVYLISFNWLQRWKKYIKYEKIKNKQIIQWNQQFDENILGQMNKDLIDQKFVVSVKNEGGNNYLNVVLKDGLTQGIDFICVNQQIWNIFKHYKHIQIKRHVNQRIKKVQFYPLKINLIFLSNRILKELKQRTKQQLSLQKLQVSKQISLGQFQAILGQKLSQILALRHHYCLDQINYNNTNKRFILINDSNFDEEKIFKRLAMSLLYQKQVNSYSIYLPIKVLNFDMEFKYQVKADQATIICQFIEENENPNNRICYSSNYIPFAQCPKCKQKKKLQFFCDCKYIAYCSQPCLNTDINHRKKCIKKHKQTKKVLSVTMQMRNGLVGLANLGNTCYMNSGIQCISNIHELAEYYITDKYIKDVNSPNWLGKHGNLSNSFANLLKNLWSQQINQFYPCQFKETIDCYQSIFSNGGQHDSGQFISYLLDGLHEDLNKGNNQIQIQQKQIQSGKLEKVIAGQQWKNYLVKHNSKIVELMHGQYRSEIECLTCSHKTLQFDPFTICHLPIPNLNKTLCIILQDDLHLFQQKFIYYYQANDILSDAINKIRSKNGIPNDAKILVYYHNLQLKNNKKIQQIVKNVKGQIYARIMLKQQKQTGCKIIVNYKQIKNQNTMHQEYTLINSKLYRFNPQLTYEQLHHILYNNNKDLLNIGDYQNQNFQSKSRKIMIHIQRLEYIGVCMICKQKCKGCQLPYSKQKIGSIFLNKTVALRYLIKDKLQKQYKKVIKQLNRDLNLYDCIEKFEQTEILTKDNSWYCPKCQQNVQARKQMMIYKTPKILIINLKRFNEGQKNQSLINFTISELDLTYKVINAQSQQLQNLPDQQQIKVKQKQKIIYDLFAVSNHYGTIQKGHYTAFCKNINKKSWYQFDDNIVKPLDQQKIVQNAAYILFYRRR